MSIQNSICFTGGNQAFITTLKNTDMKNLQAYFFAFMLILTMTLSSCDVIGDIFQAGMWTAVIIIVIVIALIMWLLRKIRR